MKINLSLTLSILGLFLLMTNVYAGTTYYVSPDGDDGNDGLSIGNAFESIQAGIDAAYAGDTVHVMPGTYRCNITFPRSGTSGAGNQITIEGHDRDTTILDGGIPVTDTGFTGWSEATAEFGTGCGIYKKSTASMPFEPFHITWNNKYILKIHEDKMDEGLSGTGFDLLQESATSESWDGVEALFGEYNGNVYIRFRDKQDPDTQDVTFGKKWNAENPGTVNIVGQDYIVVKNFTIRGGGDGVIIRSYANYNIIEDNKIMHGKFTVLIHGYAGACNNNIIRNNQITLEYIHTLNPLDELSTAIWLMFKIYSLADRAGISFFYAGDYNEAYGNEIFEHFDGIKDEATPDYCQYLNIYNNSIYDCSDSGLELIGGEKYAEWHDNSIDNCINNIRIKKATGPLYIYNNTSYTLAGHDFYFSNGTTGEIYIYQNSFGGAGGMQFGSDPATGLPNTWIVNNIFSNENFINTSLDWDSALEDVHFGYNYCGGNAAEHDWMDEDGNIIASAQRLWNPLDSVNFGLTVNSPVLSKGVDLSTSWTLDGTNYNSALPGMASSYFSGSQPDLGAIQYKPLMAHWKLDETSGANAVDSSGNGNDGTVNGTISWIDGNRDGALEFDDDNTYVNCGNDNSLNDINAITFAMWLKVDSIGAYQEVIYNRGNVSTSTGYNYIYINSAGDLRYFYANGTNSINKTLDTNLSANTWTHLVVTHDRATKTIKAYLNGNLVDTKTYTDTALPVTSGTAYIGGYNGTPKFAGTIDNFRIYNYALNAAEVKTLDDLLLAHWKFDESSNFIAYDSSSNNIYGYLDVENNETEYPEWGSGIIDGGVVLDRVNYIYCGDNSALNDTDAVTYAVWLRKNSTGSSDTIYARGISSGSTGFVNMYINTAGDLRYYYANGTNAVMNTLQTDIVANTWTHVALIHDRASKTIKVYKDGDLADTKTYTDTALPVVTGDAYIGGVSDLGNFDGTLDDFRIYNYALSEDEVEELVAMGN